MDKTTFCGTIAIIGRPNAGKSTFLNLLIGQKIAPTSRKPQTTRRNVRGILTIDDHQYIFLDTPGKSSQKSLMARFLEQQIKSAVAEGDLLVLMIDAREETAQIDSFYGTIFRLAGETQKPLFLILNKIDLLADKTLLLQKIDFWQKRFDFAAILPISAMDRTSPSILLEALAKKLPEKPFLFDPDLISDASEKEIVAELIREKVMLELSEEIPYQIAITIEEFDESRRFDSKKPLVSIQAVIHVEKESQKAIVIGKLGQKVRDIGKRARVDLEWVLGVQVMLRLFVRVEPGWTSSEKGLRKLGYL